ncbi:MAG: rhomboid family intramembrane serine protease [Kiritimatiellales bacterium]|nr:rhomboid family intramembrane serine protease [Kiritimatiellales bacterium]
MKQNAVAIFLAAFLLIVFAIQCRIPNLTAALAVRTGEHEIYRFASCLLVHGSATHVIVNSAALIILMYGFGRQTSAFLIVHALPAALCAVWLYSLALMPNHAWLCGSSPLIYALFGLIAWRERKTSVFSLFGVRCLSLPPVPMLGIVLLTDALFSKTFFPFIAWPVHTLAGLGGLITGMLLSFKPLRISVEIGKLKLTQGETP